VQRGFAFGDNLLIVLALAEFDQRDLVVQLLLDPSQCRELVIKRRAL